MKLRIKDSLEIPLTKNLDKISDSLESERENVIINRAGIKSHYRKMISNHFDTDYFKEKQKSNDRIYITMYIEKKNEILKFAVYNRYFALTSDVDREDITIIFRPNRFKENERRHMSIVLDNNKSINIHKVYESIDIISNGKIKIGNEIEFNRIEYGVGERALETIIKIIE